MRSLYVPLSDEVLHLLGNLAREERRHPKDTASLMLEEAIRQRIEAQRTSAVNDEDVRPGA